MDRAGRGTLPVMADGEPGKDSRRDQPSLELPKLGLRRRRRTPAPEAQPDVEQTRPLVEARPRVLDEPVPEPAPEPVPEPPRETSVRGPGGMPAAVLTGVVVGLGIVGLTWASLRLCESVQGTSSCGDAGYALLIAILAAMIVVGALLLRLARVPEPGSTSFLAVGLTSVLALLFLVDSLMDRPMVVVIPLITAGTFALAHWVTRTFTDPADR
jgi:hypothetical protein